MVESSLPAADITNISQMRWAADSHLQRMAISSGPDRR